MDALDPRHATEAGHEQHLRDNETPCDDCTNADLIASRRRSKRRTMGHQFTKPIGTKIYDRLTDLRHRGARVDDIADWAGITNSQVCRILENGPEGRVYARTWLALHDMKAGHIITDVGIQRRLQALGWLGWSPAVIAARAGVCEDTISDARNKGVHLTAGYRQRIADLYDELAMMQPPSETVVQRRAAGNVRSWARRRGYAAPLAWDEHSIDDPDARPHGRRTGRTRLRKTDVDPVVVDRVMAGDRLDITYAERREIVKRARELGWSEEVIEKRTGITKATDPKRFGDAA